MVQEIVEAVLNHGVTFLGQLLVRFVIPGHALLVDALSGNFDVL